MGRSLIFESVHLVEQYSIVCYVCYSSSINSDPYESMIDMMTRFVDALCMYSTATYTQWYVCRYTGAANSIKWTIEKRKRLSNSEYREMFFLPIFLIVTHKQWKKTKASDALVFMVFKEAFCTEAGRYREGEKKTDKLFKDE